MENDTGSWRLFTRSVGQHGWVELTLVDTSYADHLQFIKDKAHTDSSKTPFKLDTKLELKEIISFKKLGNFSTVFFGF